MTPGAIGKFGAPILNLSSFGSKFTVLKKALVTLLELFGAYAVIGPLNSYLVPWELCPSYPPFVTPLAR